MQKISFQSLITHAEVYLFIINPSLVANNSFEYYYYYCYYFTEYIETTHVLYYLSLYQACDRLATFPGCTLPPTRMTAGINATLQPLREKVFRIINIYVNFSTITGQTSICCGHISLIPRATSFTVTSSYISVCDGQKRNCNYQPKKFKFKK